MRQILFKAKCAEEPYDWVEGYLNKCEREFIISNDDGLGVFIKPDTICQYTGLTDKNGNKIWENDVVRCNYNDYGEKGIYIGKVIFREDTCTFVVTDGKSTDYEWWNEEKEVIGNIYDATEIIYNAGYEKGYRDGKKEGASDDGTTGATSSQA